MQVTLRRLRRAVSHLRVLGNFPLPAPFVGSSLPLPTSLGGLSFQFGNVASPMLYAGIGQANIQVPWELAGLQKTTISAGLGGQTSPSETVPLATYAPSIFTTNGAGTRTGSRSGQHDRRIPEHSQSRDAGRHRGRYLLHRSRACDEPARHRLAGTRKSALQHNQFSDRNHRRHSRFGEISRGSRRVIVGLYPGQCSGAHRYHFGSAVPLILSIGGVPSNAVTIAVQ